MFIHRVRLLNVISYFIIVQVDDVIILFLRFILSSFDHDNLFMFVSWRSILSCECLFISVN